MWLMVQLHNGICSIVTIVAVYTHSLSVWYSIDFTGVAADDPQWYGIFCGLLIKEARINTIHILPFFTAKTTNFVSFYVKKKIKKKFCEQNSSFNVHKRHRFCSF